MTEDFKVEDGILISYEGKIKDVIIPDGIVCIGDSAFSRKAITSVTIPNGVKRIDSMAFMDCSNLTDVTISSKIIRMGDGVFDGCTNLKTIRLPKEMKLDSYMLGDCGILNSDWKHVPLNALPDVEYKQNYTIGFLRQHEEKHEENYEEYSKYAISQRKKLLSYVFESDDLRALLFYVENKKVTVENYENEYLMEAQKANAKECVAYLLDWKDENIVKEDGFNGFEKELDIDPYNKKDMSKIWSFKPLGDGTLELTSYKGTEHIITIPERIGDKKVTALTGTFDASKGNFSSVRSKITHVTIPDGITVIGKNTFYCCSELVDIAIPDGVREIGDSTFCNCLSLTSIALPDSVTRIGSFAFSGCWELESITIPDSVNYIGTSAFWMDKKLCITASDGSYAHKFAVNNGISVKNI